MGEVFCVLTNLHTQVNSGVFLSYQEASAYPHPARPTLLTAPQRPLSLVLASPWNYSAYSRTSYKWIHIVCALLSLVSLVK